MCLEDEHCCVEVSAVAQLSSLRNVSALGGSGRPFNELTLAEQR